MTDSFALLGQIRRPWLDQESLKERFHQLTAEHHPDVSSDPGVDFSSIIAAYQLLRDPKTRLRHLLELEFPGKVPDSQSVPADLLDLFMRIASALSAFGKISKKLEAATAPLAIALLAGEKNAVLAEFTSILKVLGERESLLSEQLRQLDAKWPGEKESTIEPLAQMLQQLSYLLKWSDQIREGILRLNS
jgi:curved DNA-binding protein CbpA